MRSFKQFVKEETMPYAGTKSGVIDIRDSAVRDGLNQQLAGVTAGKFITPYIAFERVCKALANFHIFPPRTSFLEGDSGAVHFRIDQFGSKIGMNDDGQVVVNPELPFYLYFEYRQSDCGMFMIFSEVIDQDELDEIMDDIEEEMNEDDVAEDREEKLDEEMQPALPETGSRKTPGSNQPVITTGVTIPSELEGSNRDKMKSKLERKALTDNGSEPLEEDNVPYIPDPESTSTADYKPASKLAEEQVDESKWPYTKDIKGSATDDDRYLGTLDRKRIARKTIRKDIKAKAHKALMSKKSAGIKEETTNKSMYPERHAAAKKILGRVAKEKGGKVGFQSTTFKDGKAVTVKGYYNEKGERVITDNPSDQKKK